MSSGFLTCCGEQQWCTVVSSHDRDGISLLVSAVEVATISGVYVCVCVCLGEGVGGGGVMMWKEVGMMVERWGWCEGKGIVCGLRWRHCGAEMRSLWG